MSENTAQPTEVTEVEAPEVTEVDQEGPDSPEYLEFKAKTFGKEAFKKATEEHDEEREYQEFKEKQAKRIKEEEDEKNASEEKPKPEPKKEKAPEKKIWKMKVNDKEVEFDGSNEEEVKKAVQLGLSSTERFAKAAAIEKNSRRFVEALKNNPFEVLKHPSFGFKMEDLREMTENFLYENFVQKEMMTDEERKRHDEQMELKRYRESEQRKNAEKEAREKEELKEKYRNDWAVKIKDAMETSGLPKTDWTIGRMAHYMKVAISKGHSHIQPADVVDFVKQDWIKAQRDLFSSVDGEKLIELLGKENVDKVRKANLAQFAGEQKPVPTVRTVQKEVKPAKQYNSKEEMMRDIMRR